MKKPVKRPEAKAARQAVRDAYVADMRDGRRLRAVTFTHRKHEASRLACRKGNYGD